MRFSLEKFDINHYASNLLQINDLLKWDARGANFHMIIRSNFNTDIDFNKLNYKNIELIENNEIFSGLEINFDQNDFFTMIPKSHINNYKLTKSPATYAVFCCVYNSETDICTIYIPNEACLYKCNISKTIEYTMKTEQKKLNVINKLFNKQRSEQKYYLICLPEISQYTDGNLFYKYDSFDYSFPITKKMLNKTIYIPEYNGNLPKIHSVNNGYKIIQKNI